MKKINNMMDKLYWGALTMAKKKRKGQMVVENGMFIAIVIAVGGLILFLAFPTVRDVIGAEVNKAIKGFFTYK